MGDHLDLHVLKPSFPTRRSADLEGKGWMERGVVDRGRAAFVEYLRKADKYGRLRVFYPTGAEESDDWVMVHAKIMVIDDRLARIGSSNLNNRSMGFDSACDLLVQARTEAHVAAIAAFRTELVAQHLGRSAAHTSELQ